MTSVTNPILGFTFGEMAEWSNAAVLKTVDLHGSGGSNPSRSAKHKKKSRQACLNAIFLLCFATPRRRRGGMSERSDEIPEREGFISVALALAFQLARAPPARCKGCRNEVTKSLRERVPKIWAQCKILVVLHFHPPKATLSWTEV